MIDIFLSIYKINYKSPKLAALGLAQNAVWLAGNVGFTIGSVFYFPACRERSCYAQCPEGHCV